LWVKRVYPQPQWFAAITEAAVLFENTVAGMIRTYEQSTVGLHPTERTIEQEMVI